jgi:hypothetical protein
VLWSVWVDSASLALALVWVGQVYCQKLALGELEE